MELLERDRTARNPPMFALHSVAPRKFSHQWCSSVSHSQRLEARTTNWGFLVPRKRGFAQLAEVLVLAQSCHKAEVGPLAWFRLLGRVALFPSGPPFRLVLHPVWAGWQRFRCKDFNAQILAGRLDKHAAHAKGKGGGSANRRPRGAVARNGATGRGWG